MNNEKTIKEKLQKLLEELFELKELKDWDWRLEQVEDFFFSELTLQKKELLEKIGEIHTLLHNGKSEEAYKLSCKILLSLKT